MVLESTYICVDTSEYMRNGDYLPTRIAAQQDAVNMVAQAKLRSNPESNVGLMTLAGNVRVLVTLTTDSGKILSNTAGVKPDGPMKFLQGLKIAHLALKHRQGKNHKTRIVAFVGSPLDNVDEATLIKVAKKLKKEKVNVDVISFGEDAANADLLQKFIDAVNGKDGTGSHLVTIPPGAHHLSDALISSAVVQGEDGAGGAGGLIATGGGGFEFGVDPNEDPELALALRVSMEEQRARQEAENPAAAGADKPAEGGDAAKAAPAAGEGGDKAEDPDSDEAMLRRALAMSMETGEEDAAAAAAGSSGAAAAKEPEVDLAAMTEEEQIAYAMRMSMGGDGGDDAKKDEEMEVDDDDEMNDPAYLRSVLESLPGVDPQSEAVKTLTGEAKKSEEDKKDEDKDKK